jgi:arsenate reductase
MSGTAVVMSHQLETAVVWPESAKGRLGTTSASSGGVRCDKKAPIRRGAWLKYQSVSKGVDGPSKGGLYAHKQCVRLPVGRAEPVRSARAADISVVSGKQINPAISRSCANARIASPRTHRAPRRKRTMITIYHNTSCSKSRAAYELITGIYNIANESVDVVEYLTQPLSVAELKKLNAMLACPVREMLRDSEIAYKELGLDRPELSDDQLYEAIAKHPVLMQRPIVVRNGRAVIGRPPENVKALFD